MLAAALSCDGDLLSGDEPGQLLPQEGLGIGVFVDFAMLRDRSDEYPILLHREEMLWRAGLGPGLVPVEGLALSVHRIEGHEKRPEWSIAEVERTTRLAGWTRSLSPRLGGPGLVHTYIPFTGVSGKRREFAMPSLDTPNRRAYSCDRLSSILEGIG